MYCRNCGHLLKEGDKFCPNCGARMDTQMGSSFENDFIPPFKRGLESQNEENNGHGFESEGNDESRPHRTFQFEEFNWNLEGYPTDEGKKTDDIDFNWASVMEERKKMRKEEGTPEFFEKKEEPEEDQMFKGNPEPPVQPAEPKAVEPAAEPAEEPAAEPEEQEQSIEEAIFGGANLTGVDENAKTIRVESPDLNKTTKIDKFYTYNKKNEEFQALLDQEYNRLRSHLDDEDEVEFIAPVEEAAPVAEAVKEAAPVETAPAVEPIVVEPDAEIKTEPETYKGLAGYVGVVMSSTPAGVIAYDTGDEEKPVIPEQEIAMAEPEEASTAEPEKIKEPEAEAAAEPAEAAESEGGSTEPAEHKLTFGDVFSEDEDEATKAKKPKKHTGLKVLAVILCILVIAEIAIICIKQLAPDSVAGVKIQEVYNNIFGYVGTFIG